MATCSMCEQPARMAIKTRRHKDRSMTSTLYYDERQTNAPKSATLYCKEHGTTAVSNLVLILVDEG